jgi:hypothetical protein
MQHFACFCDFLDIARLFLQLVQQIWHIDLSVRQHVFGQGIRLLRLHNQEEAQPVFTLLLELPLSEYPAPRKNALSYRAETTFACGFS